MKGSQHERLVKLEATHPATSNTTMVCPHSFSQTIYLLWYLPANQRTITGFSIFHVERRPTEQLVTTLQNHSLGARSTHRLDHLLEFYGFLATSYPFFLFFFVLLYNNKDCLPTYSFGGQNHSCMQLSALFSTAVGMTSDRDGGNYASRLERER